MFIVVTVSKLKFFQNYSWKKILSHFLILFLLFSFLIYYKKYVLFVHLTNFRNHFFRILRIHPSNKIAISGLSKFSATTFHPPRNACFPLTISSVHYSTLFHRKLRLCYVFVGQWRLWKFEYSDFQTFLYFILFFDHQQNYWKNASFFWNLCLDSSSSISDSTVLLLLSITSRIMFCHLSVALVFERICTKNFFKQIWNSYCIVLEEIMCFMMINLLKWFFL